MVINMGENRDLFQEGVQVYQPIVLPVIRQQADIGVVTDKIHPAVGRHHTAGIGEEQYEPYQAEQKVTENHPFSDLRSTRADMVHHQHSSQHQEGYTGEIVVDVGAAWN